MKKGLGQFYTTNYSYILQGLKIPKYVKHVIEPFAGTGELLKFFSGIETDCYDIDPKAPFIIQRDTLLNPPDYKNSFIITNPPYLARNKSKDKHLFDKYKTNDLYKCFLKNIITNKCLGGILIVPLNFLCESDIKLRKEFLDVYNIIRLNIFEEQVFNDTSYTVCSFLFEPKDKKRKITIHIYPKDKKLKTILEPNNNYTIGGSIFNLTSTKYKITRATKLNKDSVYVTDIIAKCIDDLKPISLSIESNRYIDETPNSSCRTYATLIIEPCIDYQTQKRLVLLFNKFFSKYRENYNSLFLTNYREKKRKRISFELIYSISAYLLDCIDSGIKTL